MNTIEERLKQFAKHLGSAAKLAESLQMTAPALQSYTNGRSKPGYKILMQLHNLGCNINWLLSGKGKMLITQQENQDFAEKHAELIHNNLELDYENNLLKQAVSATDYNNQENLHELTYVYSWIMGEVLHRIRLVREVYSSEFRKHDYLGRLSHKMITAFEEAELPLPLEYLFALDDCGFSNIIWLVTGFGTMESNSNIPSFSSAEKFSKSYEQLKDRIKELEGIIKYLESKIDNNKTNIIQKKNHGTYV